MKRFNDDFPTKKDLFYWLLIMLFLLVVIGVWRTDSPDVLANQLALGGTLLSILLAVIAIIFSFVQSTESSKGTSNIIEKISEVTQSISKLMSIRDDLQRVVGHQASIAEEIAKNLNNMKDSTTDLALKQEIENIIIEWKQTKETNPEIKDSYNSWLNEVSNIGKSNRYIILKLIDGEISINELKEKLWTNREMFLSPVDIHIILQDMINDGLLEEFVYKNDDLYTKKR